MLNLSKIRNANQQDIPFLAQVIAQSYRDVAQRFGLTPENCPKHPSNYTGEWVQSDLDRGVIYYVLERDQNICGCAALEKAGPDVCYLERLSILPQYRRTGLGSMLVHHIIQEAQALGVSNVGIGIITHQHELKKWYIALGFVEGETKSFDHLPFAVTFLSMNK